MRKILLKRILQKISLTLLWCLTIQYSSVSAKAIWNNTDPKKSITAKKKKEPVNITGRVTDIAGKPLVDVTVQVKSKLTTTQTDLDGKYTLSAEVGDILIFSVVGYVTQVITPAEKNTINVVLLEVKKEAPVTFNTPFLTQRKTTNVSALGEIRSDELTKTVSTPINGTIVGRLVGLSSYQSSGEPGSDAVSIGIRGQTPLILLDGVPQSFASINPEQIESITILKDALATAMLGIRGSNGVVAITTKKGAEGEQKIAFTALAGIAAPLNLPKFLNSYDYARLYNEAMVNDGKNPVYTQTDLDAYKNGTDPIGHPNVNWQDEILKKNAPYSRYDVSISGGRKVARYFVNLDYLSQGGLNKTEDFNSYNTGADYKRYIFRTNVDIDLSNAVNAYLNVFTRIQTKNGAGTSPSALFSNFRSTPNNAYPLFNTDGSLGGNRDYQNNLYGQNLLSGYRPLYQRDFRVDLGVKGKLDNVTPGLYVRARAAINAYLSEAIDRSKTFAVFQQTTSTEGVNSYQIFGTKGTIGNSLSIQTQNRRFYTELSAGYNRKFGEHEVEGLLMASDDNVMEASNLPVDLQGFSGKASYNYSQKYMADFAFGYNGSQMYPKNKRYGFFPAVGLGWNMAKEDFLKDQASWLDVLKIRASYGKVGNNNAGYYEYNKYYVSGSGYNFGEASTPVSGVQEDVLPATYITWEKALKLNVGIDAAFLKNSLSVTVDYFSDKYYDLLQTRGNSTQLLGIGYPRVNIGKQRYSGLELQMNYNKTIGSFSYFVSPNISSVKSKVLFADEVARKYSWMLLAGSPVGQSFGYTAEGLFQNTQEVNASAKPVGLTPIPGDIKYKDLNGDGVIDENDASGIGPTKPQIYYGFNLGGSWKGIDFSALFQGVQNSMVYLSGNSYWEFQNSGKDQAYEHNLNRWTPETASTATYPRVSIGRNVNNQQFSSYWYRSNNYVRLKSLEVGYTLPISIVKKVSMSSFRVFVNGTNLFTSTALDDRDPESYSGGYPVMKLITAGVNIKL